MHPERVGTSGVNPGRGRDQRRARRARRDQRREPERGRDQRRARRARSGPARAERRDSASADQRRAPRGGVGTNVASPRRPRDQGGAATSMCSGSRTSYLPARCRCTWPCAPSSGPPTTGPDFGAHGHVLRMLGQTSAGSDVGAHGRVLRTWGRHRVARISEHMDVPDQLLPGAPPTTARSPAGYCPEPRPSRRPRPASPAGDRHGALAGPVVPAHSAAHGVPRPSRPPLSPPPPPSRARR